MKTNEGDKLVTNKMASLDTLSGGIVFGKEEAWEKLQARMDGKPAHRIAWKYVLALAAILLVAVCVAPVY